MSLPFSMEAEKARWKSRVTMIRNGSAPFIVPWIECVSDETREDGNAMTTCSSSPNI